MSANRDDWEDGLDREDDWWDALDRVDDWGDALNNGGQRESATSFARDCVARYDGSTKAWVKDLRRVLNLIMTLPANRSSRVAWDCWRKEWSAETVLGHLIVRQFIDVDARWSIWHRELALGSGLHPSRESAIDHFFAELTKLCEACGTDRQAD